MNLLKTPLRRAIAVLAGTLIGLSGAFALAAPASAHNPDVVGEPSCATDGGYSVLWTLNNTYKDPAEITSIVLNGKEIATEGEGIGDIKVGATVEAHSSLTGTTSESADEASLQVNLEYTDHEKYHPGNKTERPGDCPSVPETPLSPSSASPSSSTPTDTPTIPVPTPPSGAEPSEPTPIFEVDCDTMTIGLDNPADGIEFKLHFKTSKGEVRDVTIKPGESKSETFSATEGFSIKLTVTAIFQGETSSQTVTIDYEQPDNCSGSGGGSGLPVTGAAAGGIAGGAAVLLAMGAGLFVLARRRKVKFTA